MKKSTLFASKVGLITLLAFIAVIGSSADALPTDWLKTTFLGIAFSFGFGLGLPNWLAHIATLLVFAIVFALGFFISRPVFKKLDDKVRK